MLKIFRISILGWLSVSALSACTLLGMNNLGTFKVTVEVVDKSGSGISHAVVKTSNNFEAETNDEGIVLLNYISSGLHVVTVSSQSKETKQFKISLPKDDGKQISIMLNDKVIK